jgi:hypothetical protein
MRDATVPVFTGVLLAFALSWMFAPVLASHAPGGIVRAALRPAPATPPKTAPTRATFIPPVHMAPAGHDAFFDGLAIAEPTGVEERLVTFDERGQLSIAQRDSLRAAAELMRVSGSTPLAELCAPGDPGDRKRLIAAIGREFDAAGMPAWRLAYQEAGCSLRSALVLRPA